VATEGKLMPLYTYTCDTCDSTVEEFRAVSDRDGGVHLCGKERSGLLIRSFSSPHLSPIPGIPNRLNQHWNEGGRSVDAQLQKHGMS
jgi:putative FmdB family regulatory protein